MPKDATKNVDRYKVRGGQLNEFDFAKSQKEFAEKEDKATKGTKSTKANKGGGAKKRKAGKK